LDIRYCVLVLPDSPRPVRRLLARMAFALLPFAALATVRWFTPLLDSPPYVYTRADHDKATAEDAGARHPPGRGLAPANAAKTTVYFGSLDEAERLAREVIEGAGPSERDRQDGNAIHDGHEVLGLVALRRGDLDRAKRELLLAGETPGSPQLDSF